MSECGATKIFIQVKRVVFRNGWWKLLTDVYVKVGVCNFVISVSTLPQLHM